MGMTSDVLKNLLKKPFTIDYPRKKSVVSKNFRGKIHVERKKCIGCFLCQVNCPTGAIVVNKKSKKAEVDEGLCILCSMCSEVCPVKCIHFTNEYETAVRRKRELLPKKR
jgi:formate hydrogenlyase subunit 6/NADH:ubiquinone oxidoreductase subunit I